MPQSSALADLSSQLADAVERAGASIVAIHARRRIPSSGIIWRDGLIVSASHTVKLDVGITVSLPNGESVPASIVGRDPATDLIVLKLQSGAGLTVAARGESDSMRVGALVLAVGRPGPAISASFGVISAVSNDWRSWQGSRVDRVLRLDLAIYDGFSGGPLVDAGARVLGVNNSALARGIPMALPAGAVDRVVDELVERGHVRRPFIGVAVQPVALSPATVKTHGLATEHALLVLSVADESPADTAGLTVGDVMFEANGERLRRPTDLLDALSSVAKGKALSVRVLSGGKARTVAVTPADRSERGSAA